MDIKKRIKMIAPLSRKEQRELIATGDVALMKQYLGKKTLSLEFPEATQVALVKTGNIELIAAYHREFGFCTKAQVAVVRSGNMELIKAYEKRWGVERNLHVKCFFRPGDDGDL